MESAIDKLSANVAHELYSDYKERFPTFWENLLILHNLPRVFSLRDVIKFYPSTQTTKKWNPECQRFLLTLVELGIVGILKSAAHKKHSRAVFSYEFEQERFWAQFSPTERFVIHPAVARYIEKDSSSPKTSEK